MCGVATDIIEEGYLMVKAQWLKLEKKNLERGRAARVQTRRWMPRSSWSSTTPRVRLSGLRFVDGKEGAQGRSVGMRGKDAAAKEAAAKMLYISRETVHCILSLVSE